MAIVGAGFTGLSAARIFAQRGAKVAVLEANRIGWGASSRNGGMVLTGLKLSGHTLSKRYGMELARRMYAASIDAIALVEQIVGEENILCSFFRGGHLEVASKQSHFEDFSRSCEFMAKEFNHEMRIVPKNELRSEIGSDIYYGGRVDAASAAQLRPILPAVNDPGDGPDLHRVSVAPEDVASGIHRPTWRRCCR